MSLDPIIVAAIAVVVVLLLVAAVVLVMRRGRNSSSDGPDLEGRFGDEYDRTVERSKNEDAARAELRERLERREQFDVRDLDDQEREQYVQRWGEVQREFVDQPAAAVERADGLLKDAMSTRGYPVEGFEQRARDLSVDHPDVVEHYRSARTALDGTSGTATERQRTAMLHLRELFEHVVGAPGGATRTTDTTTDGAR